MKLSLVFAAIALGWSALAASGCAADGANGPDDADEASASQEEINASSAKLVGAYRHAGGALRPPTFEGLVLNADGTFFADVDTGIRCIMAPCPSEARIVGRFRATMSYLRLTAAKSGGEGADYYGRYEYTVNAKGDLSLARAGQTWTGWSNDLSKETSYCAQTADCDAQSLIHPMCVGGWTCGKSAAYECSYQCSIDSPQ
jgi:hypothetical protein